MQFVRNTMKRYPIIALVDQSLVNLSVTVIVPPVANLFGVLTAEDLKKPSPAIGTHSKRFQPLPKARNDSSTNHPNTLT